jgi:hypothetical protein
MREEEREIERGEGVREDSRSRVRISGGDKEGKKEE